MPLGIRLGHIRRLIPRRNEHTGLDEDFDPNQIFLSPAIKYSSNKCYASFKVPIPCPLNHAKNEPCTKMAPCLNHAQNGTIMIAHDQTRNLQERGREGERT